MRDAFVDAVTEGATGMPNASVDRMMWLMTHAKGDGCEYALDHPRELEKRSQRNEGEAWEALRGAKEAGWVGEIGYSEKRDQLTFRFVARQQ